MNKVGGIGMKRAFLLQKESVHVFFTKKRLFQCQCLTTKVVFVVTLILTLPLKRDPLFAVKIFDLRAKTR